MARAKKQTLTPEELLEQALVPESEQPYQVPGNWVWTRLTSVFINMTSSHKKLQQKDYLDEGLYAVVDQGKELVGGFTDDETLLYDGDLPVIVFGDHTRIVKYIDFQFAQGADGVKLLYPRKFIDEKLFFYVLQNVDIPDMGYRRHFPLFPQYNLPLPPPAEQRRIVERIESLFEKLDRAKELAQSALDSFETRKAAILHKAFTGELTAKWREENGVSMESWAETNIGCLFEVFSGKGFKEKEYAEQGVKLLRITNVTYDQLLWEDVKYLPEEYIKMEPDLVLLPNDIVLALNRPITNGKVKVSAIDNEGPYILYQRVGCLRKKHDDIAKFFLYYMHSRFFKQQLEDNLQGSDQPYINLPPLKAMFCHRPTLPEQQEIVRILDSLFEKEQRARELCDIIEKIDLMKKSILARAFRGELGTNDPREESAAALLQSHV